MNKKLKCIIKRVIITIPFFEHLYLTYRILHLRIVRVHQNYIEGRQCFEKEKPQNGSWRDYKYALNKYLVSYSEYMYQYEFWHLNDIQRHEFISRLEMRLLYEKIVPLAVRHVFWNKAAFLKKFSSFIHRRWLVAREASIDDFCDLISSSDCIAKPIEGSLGQGIFKITKGTVDIDSLYHKCVENDLLIEECISNEESMAAFHRNSLNTIRIVTYRGGAFGAFIRFGRHGKIIDNAHAGGIFAQIDPNTGMIESDAIDTERARFTKHPDSNVPIKGFVIPRWSELVDTCKAAHAIMPDAPVVGWDICIDSNNNIEIIEGNHMPDVDLLQSPLKIGIRTKVETLFAGEADFSKSRKIL